MPQYDPRKDPRVRALMRKEVSRENRKWPSRLKEIPREDWEQPLQDAKHLLRALRSRRFLVQVFQEPSGLRLSINRTKITASGEWSQEIQWHELMSLKTQAGYEDRWAYECFPPVSHVVNAANMRHLFLPDVEPTFGWR